MTPAEAVVFTVVLLALLGVCALARALVRRYERVRDTFDTVAADEAPEWAVDLPTLVVLPDGFTCLRREENPALPDRLWCAVCTPIVDAHPAEPVDRDDLEASIARHPAGKQRKTGGDQ